MTAILIGPCCCKCCVNLRYRIWLIGMIPGVGAITTMEWEITQGAVSDSGTDDIHYEGVHAYVRDNSLIFHNETDKNTHPFYFTDPTAAFQVWQTQSTGYIDTRAQCDEIRLRLYEGNPFCPDVAWVDLFGEDIWTESIYIQTGTAADLPNPQDWDSRFSYKYGHSDWHEVELCEP